MNKDILTPQQILFLELISKSKLAKSFYLSGGTALVGFYLPYRYSDDLDFFSEEEFSLQDINIFLKSIKPELKYLDFDVKTVFNRNLFFLNFDNNYQLKLEFTYYPFKRIEPREALNDLSIDSIKDIAVNKLFTIYQSPRTRDFSDLYSIIQEKKLTIENLILAAKIKFDWHVDKLSLGKQFMKVKDSEDKPRFINNFSMDDCQQFFLEEAKKLGLSVLN